VQESQRVFYYDGQLYDSRYEHFTEDVPFYSRQIKKYGNEVLELMCGTGRVTIPLAEKGFRITGIDISNEMLQRGREKSQKKNLAIEWVQGDCRNFSLNKLFPVVILPFNSFAHLHYREDAEAFFDCVKKHLQPRGKFIFDFINPRMDLLAKNSSVPEFVGELSRDNGSGTIRLSMGSTYDSATQINAVQWYYVFPDGKEERDELKMRIYFPEELDMLLHYNGFVIEEKFGNYYDAPFSSDSPKQLFVCSVR